MFIGEYEHTVDGKNRLSIPRKFREIVDSSEDQKGFFLTLGLDSCLFLFTKKQWDGVIERLESRPFTNEVARGFQRLFFSSAVYVDLDNQGRVLIPENLKRRVGIVKKVAVVGVNARIELWDRERWRAMKESSTSTYESMAQQLF
jgi:MraZ protein